MSGEFEDNDAALIDIEQMLELGFKPFEASFSDPEEALFRMRRAYDRSWQAIWDTAFGSEDSEPVDPATSMLQAFDRIWSMAENANTRAYAQFASMCHYSKNESNEVKIVVGDNASYYYESKFADKLKELCVRGSFNYRHRDNEDPIPAEKMPAFLMNYLTVVHLTWIIDNSMGKPEAQLGVRNLIYGNGPTEFS